MQILKRIRKPDGTTPTADELLDAVYKNTAAMSDQMTCFVADCGGHIEASASIYFDITPDGTPYTVCITWAEGGKIRCSRGGDEHIKQTAKTHPAELQQLWETFSRYAAITEDRLDATQGENSL